MYSICYHTLLNYRYSLSYYYYSVTTVYYLYYCTIKGLHCVVHLLYYYSVHSLYYYNFNVLDCVVHPQLGCRGFIVDLSCHLGVGPAASGGELVV